MSSAARNRSVGRKVSDFFLGGPPQQPPRTHSPHAADRQARDDSPNKLRKASEPQLSRPHQPHDTLPPRSETLPIRDAAPSWNNLDPFQAPRPPYFTADGQSSRPGTPGSRPDSRGHMRDVSPGPPLQPPQPLFSTGDESGSRPNSRGRSRGPSPSPMLQPLYQEPGELAPPPVMGVQRTKTDSLEQDNKLRRKSWMPGSKNNQQKKLSKSADKDMPRAWVAGHTDKVAYDVGLLANAQPVPELWDETGDTFLYLYPQSSGKGPSFRLKSSLFASSVTLSHLAHGNAPDQRRNVPGSHQVHSRQTSSSSMGIPNKMISQPGTLQRGHASDNSSSGSSRGTHLTDDSFDENRQQINVWVPILSASGAFSSSHKDDTKISHEDIEALVGVRNLFAFLVGQSLVATERRPTVFSIFMKIADLLLAYGFTNLDGSTYGEAATASFDFYVDELGLADVRGSREKTIEGILLGERMRSALLYNDSFVHAVGKYGDVQDVCRLEGPASKFKLITAITRSRMERASIDLAAREKSVNTRLITFEFPSIFVGYLNSKSADERKAVQFGALKEHFLATRKHVMSYYKQKYGSWPPKASSKKNDLETSGLNRLVLQAIYSDFAEWYDLWVDRTSPTTRMNSDPHADEEDPNAPEEPVSRVLRRVFDEYDRSSPPVQPPVPFDLPLFPNLTSTKLSHAADAKKKLKDDDVAALLDGAFNSDIASTTLRSSPFLQSIRTFERRAARRNNLTELVDLRAGMWLFLYVVLQALPLLVVDAPGVRFARGVEYFLCEPPRSGLPWSSPDASSGRGRAPARSWYGIPGTTDFVSLPSDLVEHGVDGVYRRSHAWLKAQQWSAALGLAPPQHSRQPSAAGLAHTDPSGPPSRRTSPDPPRRQSLAPHHATGSSRASSQSRASVVALGLEALPLPATLGPPGGSPGHSARSSLGSVGLAAGARSRPVSRGSERPHTGSSNGGAASGGSGMTFDHIFESIKADAASEGKGKKGKKK